MSPAAAAGIGLSADQVGRMFVNQYYMILENSREMMHKLYQERSLLARPDADGNMEYTGTIDGIKEKMLSVEYFAHHVKTVDSQYSLGNGVVVLVTGDLEGMEGLRRGFSQSFFLAPQDSGFFILNDILRYTGEVNHQQGLHVLENVAPQELQRPVSESEPVENNKTLEDKVKETRPLAENSNISTVEKEPVSEVIDSARATSEAIVVETPPVIVSQEMAKRSFASIVKDIKNNTFAPALVRASVRPTAAKRDNPSPTFASVVNKPAFSSDVAENGNNLFKDKENGNKGPEADGHSIFVRNLPFDVTPVQLEEGFKKFGPIKPAGIQIQSNKVQGFCFGFVEFETSSALQSAIEASPVPIGSRQAHVEEKRPQAGSRGRFAPSRGGGIRNDGPRARAAYGGGRGHGGRPEHGGRSGGRGRDY